jgi:hypothetical protein
VLEELEDYINWYSLFSLYCLLILDMIL